MELPVSFEGVGQLTEVTFPDPLCRVWSMTVQENKNPQTSPHVFDKEAALRLPDTWLHMTLKPKTTQKRQDLERSLVSHRTVKPLNPVYLFVPFPPSRA